MVEQAPGTPQGAPSGEDRAAGEALAQGPGWRVRWARPDDVDAMDAMIHELAEYEREPASAQATPQDLHRALFDDGAHVRAFVAEVAPDAEEEGGSGAWSVAGTAIWFLTYSTWTGRPGAWLEDLYVRPHARGRGVGSALLAVLAAECEARDHRRAEWAVLDWNRSAQAVYRAAGAVPMEEWTTWRVDGDALGALARRAQGRPGQHPPAPAATPDTAP